MSEAKELNYWVALLSQADLPVLRQTARDLTTLRGDEKRLNAHSVAAIIGRDPLMTVKLLRYLQHHKRKVQTTEVMLVEQALLMLGLDPIFNKVPPSPQVEEVLKAHLAALPHLLRVMHRAQRAADYAKEWAVKLRDLHFEEVRVAALLRDIAEMLMWCYTPQQMLEIQAMKNRDKTLRSQAAERQVLGFALIDLQRELAQQWKLPQLLLHLMDPSLANQPRVRNVVLAVNLSRHSANGWDDAALPDDYKGIAELLRMPVDDVVTMIVADAGLACDISKPRG